MEPIQDDIETVRHFLKGHPHGLSALDRLVAERDRLIQREAIWRQAMKNEMGENLIQFYFDKAADELEASTKTTEEVIDTDQPAR